MTYYASNRPLLFLLSRVLCARGRPLKPVTPLTLSLHNEAEVEIEVAKNEEKHYSDLIDLTSALGPKVTAFNRANPESSIQLLAKTEFRNPASQSHKDRIAKAMIAKAEERGELTDANGHKKTSECSRIVSHVGFFYPFVAAR